jgi:hypothetical protein
VFNDINTKKATIYRVRNPDPGLGKAQKCGRVKSVNGTSNLPLR